MKPCKKRESAAYAPVDIHVGQRLKIRRKTLGMSQTTLGDAIGISFQQLQKNETGGNRIGASRLFELSQILDVPISYFFDDMPPELAGQSSTHSYGLDVFDTSEAAEVTRIYLRITDPSMRLHVRELAKNIARNET